MKWIDVDQDKYRWQAFVNVVMNPLFPQSSEKFELAKDLLVFREGHCSMRLVFLFMGQKYVLCFISSIYF